MAFRKRNVLVAQPGSPGSGASTSTLGKAPVSGVRPSPLDGRLTTSTGTRSLDSLLAGYAGFVLGTSLLVEESGTTDFAGVLLRYFASEGIVQGHHIHLLGIDEAWGRELPGLSGEGSSTKAEEERNSEDKMKIAWRYERLGDFGARARGGCSINVHKIYTETRIFPQDTDSMNTQTDHSSLEHRPRHKVQGYSVMTLISANG